jgi:hypothetical protein
MVLCSSVGLLGKTLAAKVQKLQNRAFRIITRENYTTRSADILNKLKVPNLEKRRMQQLSILMYKVKNKLVPDYLYDIFTNVSDVHDHNTRQSVADLILGSFSSEYEYDYTSTRFDRVRGNHRSRSRFRSNVAFMVVDKQRKKKFI